MIERKVSGIRALLVGRETQYWQMSLLLSTFLPTNSILLLPLSFLLPYFIHMHTHICMNSYDLPKWQEPLGFYKAKAQILPG